ncbi:MAG: hypothetical protein AAGG07_01580 [Planctomycetota bacterium]
MSRATPGLFTPTLSIASRELRALLASAAGWLVIALFLLLAGGAFASQALQPGAPASMRTFFDFAGLLLLWMVPAIAMRLLSEESRAGTLEPLVTSAAGDAAITLGKYLGGLAFLAFLLAPTLAYAAILGSVSDPAPDIGPVASGYLSLALLGATYLALGLLASTLTNSQTLAYLAALLALLGLRFLASGTAAVPGFVLNTARSIEPAERARRLAAGIVHAQDLAYFPLAAGLLLVATFAVLSSRRWR